VIGDVLRWLTDPVNWRNSSSFVGIPAQVATHLRISLIAVGIGFVIAFPVGVATGHTGRAAWVVTAANALRAIPGVGLLVLLAVIIAPHFYGRTNMGFLLPAEIVLVIFAIPPILANTHAGIRAVDPQVRDAAYGMGMTGPQALRLVELPCSLPLVFSGVRSAALQVIATATIAAYLPLLGGLGRYIYDGMHTNDFPEMIGGGVLVAALALVVDLILATIQRYTVSRGISGRYRRNTSIRRSRRRGTVPG
jgi:osmoprotectant transport system permease protein